MCVGLSWHHYAKWDYALECLLPNEYLYTKEKIIFLPSGFVMLKFSAVYSSVWTL